MKQQEQDTDGAGRPGMGDQDDVNASSPATRLLDALGRGDLNAILLEFRPTTIVRTEDGTWSVQGEEDVLYWLEEAFERFPGLVLDSHSRRVGYGQVIEEARVRDIGPLESAPGAHAAATIEAGGTGPRPAPAEHARPPDRAARRRLRARDHRQLPAGPAAFRTRPARRPPRHGRLGDPVGVRLVRRLGLQDLPDGERPRARHRVRPGRAGAGPARAGRRARTRTWGRAGARAHRVDPGWTPPPYVPVEEDEKPRRRASGRFPW